MTLFVGSQNFKRKTMSVSNLRKMYMEIDVARNTDQNGWKYIGKASVMVN
jgi:hypothetical protein